MHCFSAAALLLCGKRAALTKGRVFDCLLQYLEPALSGAPNDTAYSLKQSIKLMGLTIHEAPPPPLSARPSHGACYVARHNGGMLHVVGCTLQVRVALQMAALFGGGHSIGAMHAERTGCALPLPRSRPS